MSEPINTQRVDSPLADFKRIVDMAISEATDAGISARVVADILGARFKIWDERAFY
jgi:hypothetical protein